MIANTRVREVGPCDHPIKRGSGGMVRAGCFHGGALITRVVTPEPEYRDPAWSWTRSQSGDYRRIPLEKLTPDY